MFNIFRIKKKIDNTVKEIIKFNPDILFSVDSPDFTLRVAEKVKKLNKKIKTIHYVAPQVWVWREGRVKKFKNFLDHILLLFEFEKKFFDKENIPNTFVGHPLLEVENKNKIYLSYIISNNKKVISLFCGSRFSEVNLLLPILIDFIIMMNNKFNNLIFIFHATDENKNLIVEKIKTKNFHNIEVISDENIKKQVLQNSTFAVSKSGTVSLEICNAKVPLIIIYKMNILNYLIVKMLVKIKFANIINIINNKEIIPELIQDKCNAKEIYNSVVYFLKNPELMKKQINDCENTLAKIRSKTSSSDEASSVLNKFLII